MSKPKKKLRFLGRPLTAWQHRELVSLIEMTAGRIGIHKKDFMTEEIFWNVTEALTGLRQSKLEYFEEALCRISVHVRNKGLAWRDSMITAVDANTVRSMLYSERKERVEKRSAKIGLKPVKVKADAPSSILKDEFYKSWEWRTLRMEAIQAHGRSCQCCGAAPGQKYASGEPVRICVDHIKPISKHWHLRLDLSNLQILCDECNMGKGNWSETDFRPVATVDDPFEGLDPAILEQLTDRTTGRLQ